MESVITWDEYYQYISELIESAKDELKPDQFKMLIGEIEYKLNEYHE